MLTVMPKMNQFVMYPSFKDGVTTFHPMQVIDIVGERIKMRSPYDFDDVQELAFPDVKLGTSLVDAEMRLATDVECRDALRAAIESHWQMAKEAGQVQRHHNKCIDDLERLECHLPVLQDA